MGLFIMTDENLIDEMEEYIKYAQNIIDNGSAYGDMKSARIILKLAESIIENDKQMELDAWERGTYDY